MNSGTVLLIAGVVVVGVILLTHNSTPQYAYVPQGAASEGDMAAGANAVGNAIGQSLSTFGQIFGAATAQNGF